MRPILLVLALALGGACDSRPEATPAAVALATAASPAAAPTPTPTPTPAEPAQAPPPAAPAEPAAPPVPPSALKLARELVVVEPSGELPLARDGETVVDPACTFRVVLAGRIEDARLSLLDGGDAVMPSKGTRELGATTALTLAPTSPLVPGSRYQLRVDGDRSRDLHDDAGGVHAPFTLILLVAGTPPPPEPPPAKKKRRR